MPDDRPSVPADRPGYRVFGFSSHSPAFFSAPPIKADPSQPLPDAGPFLRVFAGAEEPTTIMLRCAHQYLSVLQVIYDQGKDAPEAVHAQLSLLTFLIDREAQQHISEIQVEAGAPTNPSSYGEMVYWLAWKYLLVAVRQDQSAHADHDAAALLSHCHAFDQLVADVRTGRVRLPEQTTGVLPPKTVRADESGTDTATTTIAPSNTIEDHEPAASGER
ncbi:hypothetical protein [Nocardia colli]|uniref:hypothetical protein n=1 Tax=Nocardia colli TaxID=2545717 RepID=UPI0035DA5A17